MTVASTLGTSCVTVANINLVAIKATSSVIPSKRVCKLEMRAYFYIIVRIFIALSLVPGSNQEVLVMANPITYPDDKHHR